MAPVDPLANWHVRVFPQGRWWRYDIRRPSGGGTLSKGYRTARGASLAAKASLERTRARLLAQQASA